MNLPDPLVVGVRDHDLGHAIEKPASYGFCKTRWNSIGFISHDLSRSKKHFGVSLWAGRAVDGTIPVHLLTVVIIHRPECTFGTTFFWVWTYETVGRGLDLVWFGSEKWILFFVSSLFLSNLYVGFFKDSILFDFIRRSKYYVIRKDICILCDFNLPLFPHFFGIAGYILLWLSSYATWLGKMATIIYDKVWFSPFFYFIILPQLQMTYIAEICIPVLINLGLLGKPTSHFQD